METKLDIMSGANADGYARIAYTDIMMHLSGKFVFDDESLAVMRDVLSARWRNLGSDVYAYRIVSLSASRVTRQLACFFGSWTRLFDRHIQKLEEPDRTYVEGLLSCFDDMAHGASIEESSVSKMSWPDGLKSDYAHALGQMCYSASRFFTCEPMIHGHGLEHILDESIQLAFDAQRPMQWAQDTFKEMFFRHFPEPPPLP